MRPPAQDDAPAPPVRVDVLGPPRLTVGGEPVEVPGPKRRALLALLAMAEGRAVPVDDLLDALWPAYLPDSARATLQSHVSRLRGHMGAAAPRLEGLTGAYRLRLDDPAGGTDVARARRLLAAAGRAEGPAEARALLDEARLLWRGAPLAEFGDVAPLAAWGVTLTNLRRAVDEAHAAAVLAAGWAAEAVELASALVAADPLSEPAVLVLMRALDAAGRPAEALRAGHEHRRRLAVETGLEPSASLGALERVIAGRTAPRPRGVPRPATPLRGRDSELAALHRLLAHERLVTVLGPGGVGKTRLALELAARADPVTVLLLAPVTDPDAVPHALAGALDLAVAHGEVLAACAALLAAGPQLLVVDNCEHLLPGVGDVVGALLDSCPSLTVLATSREPLGLAAEQRLRVAPLPLAGLHDRHDLARAPAVAVFVDRARRVRPDFAPGGGRPGIDRGPRPAPRRDAPRHRAGRRPAVLARPGRPPRPPGPVARPAGRQPAHAPPDHRVVLRPPARARAAAVPAPRRLPRRLRPAHGRGGRRRAGSAGGQRPCRRPPGGRIHDRGRPRRSLPDAGHDPQLRPRPAGGARRGPGRHRQLHRLGPRPRGVGRPDLLDHRRGPRRSPAAPRAGQPPSGVADLPGGGPARRCRAHGDRSQRRRRLARPDRGVDVGVGAGPRSGDRDARRRRVRARVGRGSAWARGELERAAGLVQAGLRLGGGEWPCLAAAAMVALSRGDLPDAVELGTKAASLAARPDQSLGIAALAAAYQGDFDQAFALAERLAAVAGSPSVEGFAHYVTAETHALAGNLDRAERHYERAIVLNRECGATFADGIASVGLLTVRAGAGRVADALDGYGDLVDHWERTGGWIQQWTTLRNPARLLRTLGDDETALFLEAAAHRAPDAPALRGVNDEPDPGPVPAARAARIREAAATASRARVLETARRAITRHLSKTSAG